MKIYSPEIIDQIKKLSEDGKAVRDIASKLNLNHVLVHRIMKRHSIKKSVRKDHDILCHFMEKVKAGDDRTRDILNYYFRKKAELEGIENGRIAQYEINGRKVKYIDKVNILKQQIQSTLNTMKEWKLHEDHTKIEWINDK